MLAALRLILPALIPSWRFFESIQPSPRVQWRFADHTVEQDWQTYRPRPQTVPFGALIWRLFWNPVWNETLYSVSLAQRLTVDPTPHAQDEMFRLIARACPTIQAGQTDQTLEFRLVFVTRDTSEITFHALPRAVRDIAP